jgi:hypothetical protein
VNYLIKLGRCGAISSDRRGVMVVFALGGYGFDFIAQFMHGFFIWVFKYLIQDRNVNAGLDVVWQAEG